MEKSKNKKTVEYNDIELPQSVIDSFARFLVPEIRKYYDSEQGQREFAEWNKKQQSKKDKDDE